MTYIKQFHLIVLSFVDADIKGVPFRARSLLWFELRSSSNASIYGRVNHDTDPAWRFQYLYFMVYGFDARTMWAPAGKCASTLFAVVLSRGLTCLSLWKFYFISNSESLATTRLCRRIYIPADRFSFQEFQKIQILTASWGRSSLYPIWHRLYPLCATFRRDFPENWENL